MPGKEREIFRDCYNILKDKLSKENMDKNDWEDVKLQATYLTQEKYEDFADKMLCVELMSVVADHLMRKRGNASA